MGILKWLKKRARFSSLTDTGPLRAVDVLRWGSVGPNAAGVTVNETTSLQSSAVISCVKIIAEDIAGLPWFTFRRDDIGNVEEVAAMFNQWVYHLRANP